MKITPALMTIALVATGAVYARADGPGLNVTVKSTHVRKHVIVKTSSESRVERDGAVLYSGKVLSREYAYPRYSPGLLPTTAAIAYGYTYAPDYGFAYRLVPPTPPGAACVGEPQLVYNTSGVYVGQTTAFRCY
jgi:hypothetical protein